MNRVNHVAKSRGEKQYYNKEIHKQNYDPTVDDSLDFYDSDRGDDEIRITKNQKLQQVSGWVKVGEFLKENWMKVVLSAVSFILVFFIFNFNRDIGKIEGRMFSYESSSVEFKGVINSATEKLSNVFQQLGIIETKISYIERDLVRIDSASQKIVNQFEDQINYMKE